MRVLVLAAGAFAALAVGGCQKRSEGAPIGVNGPRGRYVGVGIYAPGQVWRQLVRPTPSTPDATAAARLDDDEQVIVVLDSATGEMRQCGNLSGHCIGFNPWAAPLPAGQGVPARLLKHAQDLRNETTITIEPAPARKTTPAPPPSPGV